MSNTPWWSRWMKNGPAAVVVAAVQPDTPPANQTDNQTADADAKNVGTTEREEDAVLLPPGASTDDVNDGGETAPDASVAGNPPDAAGATPEGTTPVPTPATNAAAAPAAAAPATNAAPDAAVTPAAAAAPATNAAEQHPVLAAALAGGIDTDAKYAQLSAEAAEGRAAIKAGRTEAKAAATARYGAEQPTKLEAAEKMIDATNSVAQLSMLTDNFLAGAPGANTARNADGSGKRVSASQAPAPNATTESGAAKPKPAAGASNGGAKPDPYAQYNNHQK